MINSYKRNTEIVCATGFALFLATFTVAMLLISVSASGPLVLGTELNPNGSVEYLCLGRGCETLTPMDF